MSRLLLVNYHYIRDPSVYAYPGIHALDPQAFRNGVDRMRARFHMASPEEAEAFVYGEGELPRDSVLLTFDDGLADHRAAVDEVLDPLGIRAVFFIASQPLSESRALMVQKVHYLRATIPPDEFHVAFIAALPENRRKALDDIEVARANAMYVYDEPPIARLKYLINFHLPQNVVDQVATKMMADHGENEANFCARTYMAPVDIKKLHDTGHLIAAHGHSHTPFSVMTPADLDEEITRNLHCLGDVIGVRPRWLSYPNGRESAIPDDCENLCERFGFRIGVTLNVGWISQNDAAHRLKRININELADLVDRSRE
jgi:peptidoglycan/xylan/chitin deacetylase (PgdA/CDA1 family)